MTRDIDVREYCHETDEAMVFDSWLNAFKRSHFRGPLPNDIYYRAYREAMFRLVGPSARWGMKTLVAYSPEDVGTRYDVFGYVVTEEGFDHPVCHFLFVKDEARRHGVGRYLMEKAGLAGRPYYYTFRTPMMQDVRGIFDRALFRPELMWYMKPAAVLASDGRPLPVVPLRDERRGRRRDAAKARRRAMEERLCPETSR